MTTVPTSTPSSSPRPKASKPKKTAKQTRRPTVGDRILFIREGYDAEPATIVYDRPGDDEPYQIQFENGMTLWAREAEATLRGQKATPTLTLDSVVLDDEKKEQIKAAISQTEHHETIFNTWGFGEVLEKGMAITILMWGPPGTGKTLCSQAIAESLGAELKIVGPAEVESSEPGGAERTIKQLFAEANKKNVDGHCGQVLLFDECDSLLTDRADVGPIISGMINTLLGEIERATGIVVFTTNRLGKLDPALERRLSAKIEFPFPNQEQRVRIWQRLIPKKAPLAKDVKLEELAAYEIAGGNIKNAVLNAARMAAYRKAKQIARQDFAKAAEAELAAQQDFLEGYNAQPHTRLASHAEQMGANHQLAVNRKVEMDEKIEMKTAIERMRERIDTKPEGDNRL